MTAPAGGAAPPARPRRRRWVRRLLAVVMLLALAPLLVIAVCRVVPPPVTPLMLLRAADGLPIRQRWVAYDAIAPVLVAAVMTSEDQSFCRHHGFDLGAIREAWLASRVTGRLRGASTISQQTAKNLLLWPGRSLVRKGLEAYLTVAIELLWPKRRILEVYLNVAEWGPGIYGAEMAAQHWFGRPAAGLTRRQAALLAAMLPAPLRWSPVDPDAAVERRAAWIGARMAPFLGGCG